jgi:hypothetical protein
MANRWLAAVIACIWAFNSTDDDSLVGSLAGSENHQYEALRSLERDPAMYIFLATRAELGIPGDKLAGKPEQNHHAA